MAGKYKKNEDSVSSKDELNEIIQYAYDMHCLLVPDKAFPIDFIADKNDIGQLHQRFLGFLKDCMQRNKMPLPVFALRWMGFNSPREFAKWKNEGTEAQMDFVDNVMATLSGMTAIAIIEKQFNMIYGMFVMKSEYDKVEKGEALKANQPQLLQQNNIFQLSTSNVDADEYLAKIRQSGIVIEGDSSGIVEIKDEF